MAASSYYTTHPSNPSNPALQIPGQSTPASLAAANISYDPYRVDAISHGQNHNGVAPSDTSSTSDNDTTGRGFLSTSSHPPKGPRKSKSDRAIKFVENQVRKQIEKKLNAHGHGSGGGGVEEQLNQAFGKGNAEGSGGGEYGYGAADEGYGNVQGGFGGVGVGEGNFEWVGESGGLAEGVDLGGLEGVFGG